MHWPHELKKGYKDLRNLTPEEKVGYDPARVAACWEVSDGGLASFIGLHTVKLLATFSVSKSRGRR